MRIGPDCWLGAKVTVTRGTFVGPGCVLAANSVDARHYRLKSVGMGSCRVLKDRQEQYDAAAARRAALEDIARKTRVAAQKHTTGQ